MKENKSIAETNNTPEVEGTTKAETATEVKNVTQAKKTGWKKYLDKKYWMIYAIVLLALIIAVTAIVWIALEGKDNDDSPEEYAQITMADLSKYALICASKTANSTMTQYWKLQSQIEDMLGAKPKAETDHIDATEFEILVGNTNREESKTFLSGLLWDDYGYAIVGNKIVIAGHTDEGTTNAMKHFLEHIKNGDHTTTIHSSPWSRQRAIRPPKARPRLSSSPCSRNAGRHRDGSISESFSFLFPLFNFSFHTSASSGGWLSCAGHWHSVSSMWVNVALKDDSSGLQA